VLEILGKGEIFGQRGFFKGDFQEFGIRSKTFTTIFKIEREDFLKVLKNYPDQYEKFQMIKEQLLQ
jgi:CRP-like cAMP-binding protein